MGAEIKIAFAVGDGENRIRIWGRADRIELVGGLTPNIFALHVPTHEYSKLASNYVRVGDVEIYRTDPAAPDVTLAGWAIDHVEDSRRGWPPDDTPTPWDTRTPSVVEKILYLVDRRWEFMDGRGGHGFFGLVNAVQQDGTIKLNTSEITAPAGGMTAFTAVKTMVERMQCASGLPGFNSDDIPAALNDPGQVAKPRDLKWDGVHCPSEAVRLLDDAEAVWSVGVNGEYAIHMIGSGALPSYPGTELPADTNVIRSRAPTTVLVTSAPLRAIDQVDVSGMDGMLPTWRYVAQDTDGTYKALAALSYVIASGKTARELFREQFASITDPQAFALCVRDLFKVTELQLSPSQQREMLPMIRETSTIVQDANGVRRPLPLRVRGKVAQYNAATRRWANSDELVELGGYTVDPINGRIHFQAPLGRVETEGAVQLRVFEPLGYGQFDVRYAHERHKGDRTDYWMRAYRRDAGGAVVISDTDAALSPAAGDVRTIGIPNLVELRVNGETVNGQDGGHLEAAARAVARRLLVENAGTAMRRYRGFFPISPNGNITAVRWILAEGVTECDLQAYHISKSAYRDRNAMVGLSSDVRQATASTSQSSRSVAQGRRDYAQPPMTWPGPIHVESSSMRWGKVLNGTELTPAQNGYHGSVGAYDGYWFEEVDPESLAAVAVGEGASPLWAAPYAQGSNSAFSPLRIGSYFPFVVEAPSSQAEQYRCLRPTDGPFEVTVTKTGGVRGSDETNCTWEYRVSSLDGITLAESKTPLRLRDPETEYFYGGENGTNLALARCMGTELILIEVWGEQADSTDCPE